MKDITNDIDSAINLIDNIDPDILGGDFEIPEDLSEYENINVSMGSTPIDIGNGLSIVDNLTTVNYSKRNNSKKFIVIHYTGGSYDNGSAAKANTNYFKSEDRGASAQLFVDMNPIIYRCVPDDYVAWHCGTTGTYYHKYCRNSNSIGIEVCSYKENGVYKFKDETLRNAILLTRYIANKYNIPRENVVMHWHITHKLCAAPFITNGKPNERWENFLDSVFNTPNVHWCDSIRDELLSNNIITDKNSWSKYDEFITKGLAIQLISNILTDDTNMPYKNNSHWASKALNNLVKKGIINDPSQWENNLDDYISNALYMSLICNIIGGVIDRYKYRTPDHWGRNCLDTLCDKEVISTPIEWINFDKSVRKDKAMALLYKVWNKYILTK